MKKFKLWLIMKLINSVLTVQDKGVIVVNVEVVESEEQ